MSTEPTPEPIPDDSTPEPPPPTEADAPTADPEPEPDPEETPPPPPPAPDIPAPQPYEPATWYKVTSVCTTQDKGDGTPCPNLNTTTTEPFVYSNAGTIVMICGVCGKRRPILDAVKLDPQPEVS